MFMRAFVPPGGGGRGRRCGRNGGSVEEPDRMRSGLSLLLLLLYRLGDKARAVFVSTW